IGGQGIDIAIPRAMSSVRYNLQWRRQRYFLGGHNPLRRQGMGLQPQPHHPPL
ncbi:hypothetical protein SARC_18316, partial [Sphaeroforma arctica JP610]